MNAHTHRGYAVVHPDDVADHYAESTVPGEFRRLTDALDADQVAVTLIRVPAHCDFEQGTGHHHDEDVEMWAISRQAGGSDSTKVDDFWEASPEARRTR